MCPYATCQFKDFNLNTGFSDETEIAGVDRLRVQ